MMRTLSGRLTMAMMGIDHPAGTADEAARDIYSLGERIAAALQLHPMSERRLRVVEADLDDSPPTRVTRMHRRRCRSRRCSSACVSSASRRKRRGG